jgi:hypothetical protein
MKTAHFFLCVGVFISAMHFSSCKKYDDGPALSLKTKKARVANEWKYDQVLSSNGTNITSSYANQSIEFKRDGTYITSSGTSSGTGTWIFASDKEDIVLTENDGGDSYTWHMMRLKEKELWVSYEYFGGVYEYRLSPK